MKTAEDIVQDFLFKDKPKNAFCKSRTVDEWVELIKTVQNELNESRKQAWNEALELAAEKATVQTKFSNSGIHYVDKQSILKLKK